MHVSNINVTIILTNLIKPFGKNYLRKSPKNSIAISHGFLFRQPLIHFWLNVQDRYNKGSHTEQHSFSVNTSCYLTLYFLTICLANWPYYKRHPDFPTANDTFVFFFVRK